MDTRSILLNTYRRLEGMLCLLTETILAQQFTLVSPRLCGIFTVVSLMGPCRHANCQSNVLLLFLLVLYSPNEIRAGSGHSSFVLSFLLFLFSTIF